MKTNDNVASNSGILVKYGFLIALTTSFFLLVIALSGITFVTSQQVEKATREFDVASRQTVLAQQLSKNLLDTGVYARDLQEVAKELAKASETPAPQPQPSKNRKAPPPPAESPANANTSVAIPFAVVPQTAIYNLQELKSHSQIFTDNLKAFKEGGVLKDGAGQEIPVQAVTDPQLQATLAKIEAIWTPYLGLLNNFSEDVEKGVISKQTSDFLTDYTRMYNSALQAETTSFAGRQNEMIQSSIARLRNMQIFGVGIAFLLFVAIVFGALQRLMRTDKQLAVAQRQTDDIMKTVNEGLFLIDKDLVIADQYSGKLEQILNQKNIAGRTLYDILKGMISQKDMDTTKLFVEQLYNVWVVEELIQDLNPLKQVMLSYIDENGVGITQFLEFNFLRVMDEAGESVESVFVSVIDVTKEIRLQAQMQKDKEQHDRQIEMISYLLNTDSRQLEHFMSETKVRLERMNDILKDSTKVDLRAKAEQLYRETHSLKGDASAVNLGALIGLAEKQEEKLKQLLNQMSLKGDDFLPFTVGLDEMVSMVAFIDNLVQRLHLRAGGSVGSIANDEVHVQENDGGYWQEFFEKYAHDIASRQGKEVSVKVKGFDGLGIDDEAMSVYKDITVQLLKNAIVHGIEFPTERTAKGKSRVGRVELSLQAQGDSYSLQVKDDGAGIDWDRLREKAVETGTYSQEQAANLQPKDLLKLMFKSGLSTAQTQDEDAGRGVGMDIVKQLAGEAGGKIGVNSRSNQFTRIHITFPKH